LVSEHKNIPQPPTVHIPDTPHREKCPNRGHLISGFSSLQVKYYNYYVFIYGMFFAVFVRGTGYLAYAHKEVF